MSDQNTLGQMEYIQLPELNRGAIKARIDTGARTSAIWVSDAVVTNNQLWVIFFGPGSKHYLNNPLTFKEYAMVKVVNSTGQSQTRFKIRLVVRIGGRTIKAWFTLADRSQQTYPVLIGRNVLKGKFLVDVAKKGVKIDPSVTKLKQVK